MKNPWVIIGIIAIVLFGGAFWYAGISNEKNNEGVEPIEHVKGNAEASVVLTEYSDFQCPACGAFYPVVQEMMETYGDQLRFEYKHFPLPIHPYAEQAALAAEAAGQQDKFFEYHDLLFENQTVWSGSRTPQALFISYAEELGLDIDMFRRHMNSSILRDEVQNSFNEARAMGITGTPTFFLNGERMQFDTYQAFMDQIAQAVDPATNSGTDGTETATTSDSGVTFGL